jgi:hypothetical protein
MPFVSHAVTTILHRRCNFFLRAYRTVFFDALYLEVNVAFYPSTSEWLNWNLNLDISL